MKIVKPLGILPLNFLMCLVPLELDLMPVSVVLSKYLLD